MANPCCPKCGSENGCLGTSNAYFICRDCKTERYWTPKHVHPDEIGLSWDDAVILSPWATPECLKGIIRRMRANES